MASLTASAQNTSFELVRSAAAAAAHCLSSAKGQVTVNSLGNVEVMHIEASGLPPKTSMRIASPVICLPRIFRILTC
jgi:hypothetical protein